MLLIPHMCLFIHSKHNKRIGRIDSLLPDRLPYLYKSSQNNYLQNQTLRNDCTVFLYSIIINLYIKGKQKDNFVLLLFCISYLFCTHWQKKSLICSVSLHSKCTVKLYRIFCTKLFKKMFNTVVYVQLHLSQQSVWPIIFINLLFVLI